MLTSSSLTVSPLLNLYFNKKSPPLSFSLLYSVPPIMVTSANIPDKADNSPLPAGLVRRNRNRARSTPDDTEIDYDVHDLALKPTQLLFAGRLGGNQEFIINRNDPAQAAVLRKTPDAAPFVSLMQTFDLRGFREVDLWKAALVEGIGEFFSYSLMSGLLNFTSFPPVVTRMYSSLVNSR